LASHSIPGKKKDKTRITIGLCCNLDGSEKSHPVIINKYQNPRCFKGHNIGSLPLHFYANKKAWMTSDIFLDWVRKFNLKMSKEERYVLLLVDNASSHFDIELSNVKIRFLPPNTTCMLQPMDAGIIKSFKAHYRRFFLLWIVAQIEGGTGLSQIDLLTAIAYVLQAWNEVSSNTIRNCWIHTRIMTATTSADLKQQNEPKKENRVSDLEPLIESLSIKDAMSSEEYVSVDADVPTEGYDDEEEVEQEPECEEDELTMLTCKEAFTCANKLSAYASLHGLHTLNEIVNHSRTNFISSLKQKTLDSYFTNNN
jgi:hypothetical protein